MPARQTAAAVRHMWQEIQHDLEQPDLDPIRAATLRAAATRLQDEYLRLVERQTDGGHVDLPPIAWKPDRS